MKKLIVFFFVFVVFIFGSGFLWYNNALKPKNPEDESRKIFVVEKSQGLNEIADSLEKEKLIKSSFAFFILAKQEGIDTKIQAGDFRLSPSMSSAEIADQLTHGILDIWVTIPEGYRAEEIADILEKEIPSYDDSWRILLNDNEGYLFPDTYLIPKDADINLIITLLRDNFEKKYQTLDTTNSDLSRNEIVTVASLVEREARLEHDRPLVASVILNRLEIGMKLDIDATLQYTLGYQKDEKRWWKKALTNEDKEIDSPYNTYKRSGLPPAPISNPGLSSLKAVVEPAETDYFYYISDSTGVNHYAKTLEEHNENIRKFGL